MWRFLRKLGIGVSKQMLQNAALIVSQVVADLEAEASMTGRQKRAAAQREIKAKAKECGLNLTPEQINLLIEIAVNQRRSPQ